VIEVASGEVKPKAVLLGKTISFHGVGCFIVVEYNEFIENP
jgi:hypothetical protein